ncbi:MAG: hypothetical protein KG028_00045 [Actinobacteria bacterium]|jgi:hypothetical protein|nr:hypothetical protein [Actinomycetota bacterium]
MTGRAPTGWFERQAAEALTRLSDDELAAAQDALDRTIYDLDVEGHQAAAECLIVIGRQLADEGLKREEYADDARIEIDHDGHSIYVDRDVAGWMVLCLCTAAGPLPPGYMATRDEAVTVARRHAADTGGQLNVEP